MFQARIRAFLMETGDVEAHISTVEPGPQAAPRLSRAHGNESWSQDPERAPRQGPEIAERLTLRLFGTDRTAAGNRRRFSHVYGRTGALPPRLASEAIPRDIFPRKKDNFIRIVST